MVRFSACHPVCVFPHLFRPARSQPGPGVPRSLAPKRAASQTRQFPPCRPCKITARDRRSLAGGFQPDRPRPDTESEKSSLTARGTVDRPSEPRHPFRLRKNTRPLRCHCRHQRPRAGTQPISQNLPRGRGHLRYRCRRLRRPRISRWKSDPFWGRPYLTKPWDLDAVHLSGRRSARRTAQQPDPAIEPRRPRIWACGASRKRPHPCSGKSPEKTSSTGSSC